jgi:hypothetical protein
MTTRATRRVEDIPATGSAAPCRYMAFELGLEEWKLGFATKPTATPHVRTLPVRVAHG